MFCNCGYAGAGARCKRVLAPSTQTPRRLGKFGVRLASKNAEDRIAWPSPKYAHDPVGFARDILGIELWAKQIEIVESIRDHRNTSVRSGHKCGKSTALAVAAIWFYCCFDRARVLMTAVKASQVDEVMWKEVRRLVKASRKRGTPVDGDLHELARSGLRADDERQIWGATARDGEGLAGISGPNILILVDEASGVHDRFFETLGTSLAGDGGTVRKCYISNPTRTVGDFYKSHTTDKLDPITGEGIFNCIHISSEETPNARGLAKIPGLAGPEWIAEKRREWGVESPRYAVRVLGNFVQDKDGKIIPLNLIALAQQAWDETISVGDLQLGIDPAGDGVAGDETSIAVRRGKQIVCVRTWTGISEDEIVAHALALVADYRKPREPNPRVAIDAEGGIGSRVLGLLRAQEKQAGIEVLSVRSGKKMFGSHEYHLVRDALWGETAKWLKSGGAIPDDAKLSDDLNAPSFVADTNRRYRATDKKELRKMLGRSTDRGDSVCLAVWQGTAVAKRGETANVQSAEERSEADARDVADLEDLAAGSNYIDPYAGAFSGGI